MDFIYASGTAVFDLCEIHCKADGYITAASTHAESKFGFVFLDRRVTVGPGVEQGIFLARPWRDFSATAFNRTGLHAQIRVEGWHNWGKVAAEKTVRYLDYQNTGPGVATEKRVSWAPQLTDDAAKDYTVENILRGPDGWKPR